MLWCVGQVGYPIAREWTGSISKLLVTVEAVASTPSSFWYPSGPWRTMCSFSYSLRWGVYTKKKSIMIVQYHSLMGKGTRKRKSTEEEPGINMIGNSYTTRVLWSVMLGRAYGGKRKNRPLLKLISYLSNELTKAFYEGIPLQHHKLGTIYLIPLCMKGDWPALTKLGGLTRHFGCLVTSGENGKGICHMCNADRPGFQNWHDLSYENMEKMHEDPPLPWRVEPSLVSAIPLHDLDKPYFFRVDAFHALHKGFMGDIAANALVSRMV